MIFFTISKSFFSLTLKALLEFELKIFFFIIIFGGFLNFFLIVLNAVLSLIFCCYRVCVSSGLCTHWFIIVGLPLNTGVLVLIFLKINNKRALKHALFQEKKQSRRATWPFHPKVGEGEERKD